MHMVIPFVVLALVQSNALILCNYSSFVEILCLAYWFAPVVIAMIMVVMAMMLLGWW